VKRLAIIGGGSWGTALAVVQAPNFPEVRVLVRDPEMAGAVAIDRENRRYLPGITIPDNVRFSSYANEVLPNSAVICVVVPSAHMRSTLSSVKDFIPADSIVISATKGLEPGTLLCMSQVIAQAASIAPDKILVLSGPSFAIETAQGLPTAVVVAGPGETALRLQNAFAGPTFRVYSSEDRVGVEVGGSLKNVIAIGAGMAFGLGLGHNAISALVTRGLAEMTRLATAMGADPRTLSGLAGLGDLVLTCTGDLSRNRQLGIELSRSVSVSDALAASVTTTEGVRTATVAFELGKRLNVTMPIADEMHAVLVTGRPPAEAIRRLMDRSLREEQD
jgi:glycerol-3-phosphate dehydrogenase (NAD(P)+)